MLVTGLAFLLFAGILSLNQIGLEVTVFAAALITGIVFVGIALLTGGVPNWRR